MADGKIVQTGNSIKSGGSFETDIARTRHDANSSQGEIPKLAGREFPASDRAQFGLLHPLLEGVAENSKPKPIAALQIKVLRRLASAMFGLSKIFDRLGQRFRALSVPAQPISALELTYLNEPGHSLEELVEALVCGREPVPFPKPCSPVAKSCPIVGNQQ